MPTREQLNAGCTGPTLTPAQALTVLKRGKVLAVHPGATLRTLNGRVYLQELGSSRVRRFTGYTAA